ncbi:MAG: sigma-54 interaction domain-containing protein [Peptococcaceae bacterium]
MNCKQLKVENELLQKIIDASYDGIFITDCQGKAIYCNEAYLRISGLCKDKVIGYDMRSLIRNREIPDACSPEVAKTRKPVTKVIDYYNGVSALVTSIPIFDDEGCLVRIFSNVRDITELLNLQEKLKSTNALNNEYRQLLWKMKRDYRENIIVANSPVVQNILRLAVRISHVSSPVLIQGESGVGKDLIARYIHDAGGSSRQRPFIHINCSAIPESLLESELFGYEPGAFTGASKSGKRGMFELANGGTLFLDEIGEITKETQVKLLDVLQYNKMYRVGGTKTVTINTRIIAATNNDLEKLIKDNKFRQDLYYRLNVIPIFIPPLRERKEDIVPLIVHFIKMKNDKFGFNKKISPQVVELLVNYNWPGNVRELKNVLERMVVLAEGNMIDEVCVPHFIKQSADHTQYISTPDYYESFELKKILEQVEYEVIKKALTVCGPLRNTAAQLGIDVSTLVRKKKKYGI